MSCRAVRRPEQSRSALSRTRPPAELQTVRYHLSGVPSRGIRERLTCSTVSPDIDAIKSTLNSYRDALVASDSDGCASLYTKDGVTMAQSFTTQVGKDAITKWYAKTFDAITLNVEFDVKEVVMASDSYAFARTTSAGTQKINKTGETTKEANQELFVLQKVESEWKIARYCFCTTNPPK